jgi:hypothetical protein
LIFRKAGNFDAAEELYRQGYQEAVRLGDKLATVRYLMSVGGCQFGEYHYQDALSTFLQARELAAAIGDHDDLGAIAGNLSSLYLEVWDLPAATRAADEGLAESQRRPGHSYFEAPLRVQVGRLHALLKDGQARQHFIQGIEAARAQENPGNIEALGWDLLGEEYLAAEDSAGAEKAFLEAFRLRTLFNSAELGFSYARLGALELARGHLDAARRFTDRALTASRRGKPAYPAYRLLLRD